MTPSTPIGDDDLHAFVDGRLAPERRSAVEAAIAADAEIAARVDFYRQLNDDLHRLYDGALSEAATAIVPVRMTTRWRAAAIAAAALIAGLVGGWFARDVVPIGAPPAASVDVATTWPLQAARAHAAFAVDARRPVEVAAEADLVRWLTNRLGREVRAPQLASQGFKLIGGRLLPVMRGGVAGQFMYEDAAARRITLYLKPTASGDGQRAFQFASEPDGLAVFYWLDDRFGYALAGKLTRDELMVIARAVYEQLGR